MTIRCGPNTQQYSLGNLQLGFTKEILLSKNIMKLTKYSQIINSAHLHFDKGFLQLQLALTAYKKIIIINL